VVAGVGTFGDSTVPENQGKQGGHETSSRIRNPPMKFTAAYVCVCLWRVSMFFEYITVQVMNFIAGKHDSYLDVINIVMYVTNC
jgi:hypothetical protein